MECPKIEKRCVWDCNCFIDEQMLQASWFEKTFTGVMCCTAIGDYTDQEMLCPKWWLWGWCVLKTDPPSWWKCGMIMMMMSKIDDDYVDNQALMTGMGVGKLSTLFMDMGMVSMMMVILMMIWWWCWWWLWQWWWWWEFCCIGAGPPIWWMWGVGDVHPLLFQSSWWWWWLSSSS